MCIKERIKVLNEDYMLEKNLSNSKQHEVVGGAKLSPCGQESVLFKALRSRKIFDFGWLVLYSTLTTLPSGHYQKYLADTGGNNLLRSLSLSLSIYIYIYIVS